MPEEQIGRMESPPTTGMPRQGRYEGANEHAFVELRVDAGGSGPVSADVYRVADDRRDWVASLRSAPGAVLAPGEAWPIVAEDDLGAMATGGLTVEAGADDTATVILELDSQLNGLPANRAMVFETARAADALRSMGIEIETEQGVAPPQPHDLDGRQVTLENCLVDAGFSVTQVGEPSRIPRKPAGWDMSELHTLMQDFAQASLDEKAWRLHLLLLGVSDQAGLLGVMFDETEVLPRQGAAVFAGAIRAIPNINHERKLIQTSVHELGHALNLAHRFERVVGRADSLSFMNYDWRYLGGNHRDDFWRDFRFSFDPDELTFLRHGPRSAVIPGGEAFHSVRYWNEGTGGYSPYVPEAPLEGFRLTLRPPQSGRLFSFAQSVFLEVELTNLSGEEIDLPPVLLDPKGGFLELLVRRTHGTSTRSLAEAEPFQPILQRCYDIDPGTFDTVPHGASIRNNVNLTYGVSGFGFAEPGAYEVTALLAIFDQRNQRDLIVRSEVLPIRVAAPQSIEEDSDAMDLFRDDVGVYLALGGNRNLTDAHDLLQAIVERRQAGEVEVRDPVVAAIVRAQALDARREYVRMDDEGAFRVLEPDHDRAAELLGQLDDRALQAFDPNTARKTRQLAASYR